MNRIVSAILCCLALAASSRAQTETARSDFAKPLRPVHTFSIVARDPVSGDMGVAVQSHWFAVGAEVTWAEAGVGAVATQSFVDPGYGQLGLALLRAGKTAQEALRALLAADPNVAGRQVAMVDTRGNVACYTGAKAIQAAGCAAGPVFVNDSSSSLSRVPGGTDPLAEKMGLKVYSGYGYSAQANLMEKNTVWPAMAAAFDGMHGSLADRLIAALEAAQREGGDIRGKQSAAILIVRGKSTGQPWADKLVDLRVDDSDDPINELKRLLRYHNAYEYMELGDVCSAKHDWTCAAQNYGEAEKLLPDQMEVAFWFAVTLVSSGEVEDSLPLFHKVFTKEPKWMEVVKRLPDADLLPNDPKLLELIRKQGPK